MQLDQWLKQVYEDETLVKEGQDLETMFGDMDPSDLLDIACGRTTIEKVGSNLRKAVMRVDAVRKANPELQARLKKTRADIKKNPKNYMLGSEKTSSARLVFMDKVARQIARQHAEVAKEAAGCMTKQDEFTSPLAQQKAKAMQTTMKAAKGAPSSVRKKAISNLGKQL